MIASLLAYVEDPGAANMVLGLSDALARQGGTLHLTASPLAARYLAERGERAQVIENIDPNALLDTYDTSADAPWGVAVGTSEDPETLGLRLIIAAQDRRLPTVGLVDGPANCAHRFRGTGETALAMAPEWIFTPDPETAEAYGTLGHRADRLISVGNPVLDWVRAEAATLAAEDPKALRQRCFPELAPAGDRPAGENDVLILFAAELSDGLDPGDFEKTDAYSLTGRGEQTGRTEIVLEELLNGRRDVCPDAKLVVRLHPKNAPDAYQAFGAEIDAISTGGPPYPAIAAADVVVGLSSSLLFEAAVMGRPTLSILPRETEKAWLKSISLGLTPCATTPGQVRDLLRTQIGAARGGSAHPPLPRPEAVINFGAPERMASALADILTRQPVA